MMMMMMMMMMVVIMIKTVLNHLVNYDYIVVMTHHFFGYNFIHQTIHFCSVLTDITGLADICIKLKTGSSDGRY